MKTNNQKKILSALLALTVLPFSSKAATIYSTGNDTLNYCVNNTSSSYKTIADNISIKTGDTVSVITSRYSEWTGKVTGKGTLNILSGGERTYIGTQKKKGSAQQHAYSTLEEAEEYVYFLKRYNG